MLNITVFSLVASATEIFKLFINQSLFSSGCCKVAKMSCSRLSPFYSILFLPACSGNQNLFSGFKTHVLILTWNVRRFSLETHSSAQVLYLYVAIEVWEIHRCYCEKLVQGSTRTHREASHLQRPLVSNTVRQTPHSHAQAP